MDTFYDTMLGSSEPREHGLNLDMLDWPMLDLHHLEDPFTEEEVLRTIKSMPLDKAPARMASRAGSSSHVGT